MLWKSGETVFSTKTAACIQFWLHAYCTYYTGVSWRFSYSGHKKCIELVCVIHRECRSSPAEVLIATLRWCVPVSPNQPGVHLPVESVLMCASLPGLAGSARCCMLSETEGKAALQSFAALCTLHAPTNPLSWPLSSRVFE